MESVWQAAAVDIEGMPGPPIICPRGQLFFATDRPKAREGDRIAVRDTGRYCSLMLAFQVQIAPKARRRRTLILLALLPLLAGCAATPSAHETEARAAAKVSAPAPLEVAPSPAPTVTVTVPTPTPTVDTAGGDPGINDGGGNAGVNDGRGSAASPSPDTSLPLATPAWGPDSAEPPPSCPTGSLTGAITHYDNKTVYGTVSNKTSAPVSFTPSDMYYTFAGEPLWFSINSNVATLNPGQTTGWTADFDQPISAVASPNVFTPSVTADAADLGQDRGIQWIETSYYMYCDIPKWLVSTPTSK